MLSRFLKKKKASVKKLSSKQSKSLISAYKRNFNQAQNVRVDLNRETGSIRVFARKDVVDEVYDQRLEISIEEAQGIHPEYMVGDVVEIEVTPKDFGRIGCSNSEAGRHTACARS